MNIVELVKELQGKIGLAERVEDILNNLKGGHSAVIGTSCLSFKVTDVDTKSLIINIFTDEHEKLVTRIKQIESAIEEAEKFVEFKLNQGVNNEME